jgi:hypothetical protein
MSRAREILEKAFVYQTGKGQHYHPFAQLRQHTPSVGYATTGIGVARGGQAVHRLMRAHQDRIRQAGYGDEYDAAKRQHKIDKSQAKQDYKSGTITRGEKRQAIENSRKNVDDVADKGHDKFQKMTKGLTFQQKHAITTTM